LRRRAGNRRDREALSRCRTRPNQAAQRHGRPHLPTKHRANPAHEGSCFSDILAAARRIAAHLLSRTPSDFSPSVSTGPQPTRVQVARRLNQLGASLLTHVYSRLAWFTATPFSGFCFPGFALFRPVFVVSRRHPLRRPPVSLKISTLASPATAPVKTTRYAPSCSVTTNAASFEPAGSG
jgi:hypothetical protein